MFSEKFKKDLRDAIKIVWILYSALILIVILITIFSPETLYKISPVCYSVSLYGDECFMCGMTRAFVEISDGNFQNAGTLNSLSIYVFGLMAFNSILFIFYAIVRPKSLYNNNNSTKDFPIKKLFHNSKI